MYSRTIKVYENIDNLITISFQNSDQKPANIAGKSFTFSVTNADGNAAVWSSNITINNNSPSIGTVVLDRANVSILTQEFYNYAISYTSGALTLPAYADDNWGAAGQLQILHNVY